MQKSLSVRGRCFTAILAGLMLLAPAAWAAVDTAALEKAEALLKGGKPDDAFKLLEPLEVQGAGDLVYDYLLATAALESGRPSRATFIYERILAVDPAYVGVRADMGRAYFALGDYGRAKIEFETVLRFQNLPPDLRSSVEQYVKAAEARAQQKRTLVTAYVEAGVGHDSNIGTSTGKDFFAFPVGSTYTPAPPTGRKTSDQYESLAFGAEVTHQLDDKWSVFAGADVRARDYRHYNDPNNWTADARAGFNYAGGDWLLRTGVTAGEYVYHGERLRETVGLTVDWRKALEKSSQLTLGGSIYRYTYVPGAQSNQQNDTFNLSAGWLTALGDGTTIFSLSGSVGYENAAPDRDDGDKAFGGPRVLLQKSFSDSIGGFATAGYTYSRYRGMNDLYLISRRENLVDVTLGLTWTMAKGISLRPQLSYLKNKSNADLYSYDKTDTSLTLRYDF